MNKWIERNCILISFIGLAIAIFAINATPKKEHRQVVAQVVQQSNCEECGK